MPTIDAIVPIYGHWEMVQRCLARLVAQETATRVIVVDDCSPDDTAERVAASFPQVELVRMQVNSGFAAACNAGFAAGTGDIVVLVNSDVESAPAMTGCLARAFEDPAIGSAAPVILQPDGRLDALGICADPTLAGFVRFHGASQEAVGRSAPTLLGPYGAVAAYRRATIPNGLLFDENIFMYGEELDLALRLRAAGHSSRVVQDARAVHLGGATTGKGSARQRYLAGYGRGYLLGKYRVLHTKWAVRAVLTETIVVSLRLLASRDTSALRGRIDGFRSGRIVPAATAPVLGLETRIGFLRSLRMRSDAYWARF